MKHLIINKFKKTSGRLLLLTTVLFLMTATKGTAQCPGGGVDLQAVSIDPTLATIGINQTTTITAVMANNGPCVVAAGTANAQVTISAVDFDLTIPFNFTSNCGQWVYLGNVPSGSGATLAHNLFFRNDAGTIAVNGPLCFFSFNITGKAVTPGSPINLASSATSDINGANQSTGTFLPVTAFILPVVLADFNVTGNSCNGIVNWKTATEQNVKSFEVQYSTNGTDFTVAGSVLAKNSTSGSVYRYVNNQGTGRGYYRLKVIDIDGQVSYSRIVSADTKCNGIKSVSLFPNPLTASQNLTVIVSGYEGSIKGEMVSMSGQVIRTYSLKNGTNTLPVDKLAQATYMLRVTDATGVSESFRVVVIK